MQRRGAPPTQPRPACTKGSAFLLPPLACCRASSSSLTIRRSDFFGFSVDSAARRRDRRAGQHHAKFLIKQMFPQQRSRTSIEVHTSASPPRACSVIHICLLDPIRTSINLLLPTHPSSPRAPAAFGVRIQLQLIRLQRHLALQILQCQCQVVQRHGVSGLSISTGFVSRPETVLRSALNSAKLSKEIANSPKHLHNKKEKKWLFLSMVGNLGILFTFKYLDFADNNIRDFWRFLIFLGLCRSQCLMTGLQLLSVSFLTFQSLSYTIDVYKGVTKAEQHFGYFASFTAFWPVMVNGPIERAKSIASK